MTTAAHPRRETRLDVFEVFAPPRPPRPILVVHPDDLPFFARHNVLAGEPFVLTTEEGYGSRSTATMQWSRCHDSPSRAEVRTRPSRLGDTKT